MARWLIVCLLFFATQVFAINRDLKGAIYEIGDGSYNIKLQANNGKTYLGIAEEQEDGSFAVEVEDDDGNSFSGTAIDNKKGSYNLTITDDDTGATLQGIIDGN